MLLQKKILKIKYLKNASFFILKKIPPKLHNVIQIYDFNIYMLK